MRVYISQWDNFCESFLLVILLILAMAYLPPDIGSLQTGLSVALLIVAVVVVYFPVARTLFFKAMSLVCHCTSQSSSFVRTLMCLCYCSRVHEKKEASRRRSRVSYEHSMVMRDNSSSQLKRQDISVPLLVIAQEPAPINLKV